VVYNISPRINRLPENILEHDDLNNTIRQGLNDSHQAGYGGPCPPRGTHTYMFNLFALDTELEVSENATKQHLEKAMKGHILAQGRLTGKYRHSPVGASQR